MVFTLFWATRNTGDSVADTRATTNAIIGTPRPKRAILSHRRK